MKKEELEDWDNEKLLDEYRWLCIGFYQNELDHEIKLIGSEILKRLNGEYRDWRED